MTGLIAGVVLPFFNIPLILKMRKRNSSKDISMAWALGVWTCFFLMVPSALLSSDIVFRVFGIVNFVFFSVVVFHVLKYR